MRRGDHQSVGRLRTDLVNCHRYSLKVHPQCLCLHPDRVVQEPELQARYEEAFNLFNNLEAVLLDEKQLPTPTLAVPASPAPLAPSGLSFVGHGLLSILM